MVYNKILPKYISSLLSEVHIKFTATDSSYYKIVVQLNQNSTDFELKEWSKANCFNRIISCWFVVNTEIMRTYNIIEKCY